MFKATCYKRLNLGVLKTQFVSIGYLNKIKIQVYLIKKSKSCQQKISETLKQKFPNSIAEI